MAKRFTDSSKWGKEWFMGLSPKGKLLWVYLCDTCNHAGIWEKNLKLASCQIGLEITEADLSEVAKNVIPLEGRKVFIPGFIEFQYTQLDPSNRAHLSAIRLLEKYGINPTTLAPSKGLISPIQGYKDKDKDKEQGIGKEEGGVGETNQVQQVHKPHAFTRQEIEMCERALKSTLDAFGIERPILPHEQATICALIAQYGAKPTAYALYGMQFEQGTETFDPKKHVAVTRLHDREKFEKALNRGAAERAKEKKLDEKERKRFEQELARRAETEAKGA